MPNDLSHFQKQPFVSTKIITGANRVVDAVNSIKQIVEGQIEENGQGDISGLYERPWIGQIVDAGPNNEDDYGSDDCRYYVQRIYLLPNSGSANMDDKVKLHKFAPPAEEDEDQWPVIHTVSNLAEKKDDGTGTYTETHLLHVNTFVLVSVEESFQVSSEAQQPHYIMFATEPRAVVVSVDDTETGGGKYAGTIYGGVSTAGPDTDLSLPEGMTAGDDCLILHTPENGLPTHWLETGAYANGVVIGKTDEDEPRWIVIISNAAARTGSPVSLDDGSGTTAGVKTWDRTIVTAGDNYGDTPHTETYTTRMAIDAGSKKIYYFTRTRTIDAAGNEVSKTAETRVELDTGNDC